METHSSCDVMPIINDQLMSTGHFPLEYDNCCQYYSEIHGGFYFTIRVNSRSLSVEQTKLFLKGMKDLIKELEKELNHVQYLK